MESSKIAALGSPRPPTIASRRPMLSSQRSLSVLSINTTTTHSDMMRRNSSASIASKNPKLQTPTNVPPLPLSANNASCMSPEELSSKIADSFQQFSSMLTQLSSNKTAASTTLAPVTPPFFHKHSQPNLSQSSTIIPIRTPVQISPQKLPSPPLQNPSPKVLSSPSRTSTQSNSRVVPRPATNDSKNISLHEHKVEEKQNELTNVIPKLSKLSDDENDSDDDINFEEYASHAIHLDTILKAIEIPATAINEGNTKLRQRVISKRFIRAASVGDVDTMQNMLKLIKALDINCTNDKKSGISALMYAAYFGQISCVSLLLKQPTIKINQQDRKGWTALMWAINSNQMEAAQMLLNYGAEKSLKTHFGRTVFNYPTSIQLKELLGSPLEVVESLIEQGAEKSESPKNELVPESITSETGRKSNENSGVTVDNEYYQTAVNGYALYTSGSVTNGSIDSKKKNSVETIKKGDIFPPDFSQLTRITTTPQQEQRNKEILQFKQTMAQKYNVVDDEELKRWESSIISSSTFVWSQCLPDQMFVFCQDDLHTILDQALNVPDAKSLMNSSHLSSELWRPANIVFLGARFAHYCSSRDLLSKLLEIANVKLSRLIKTNNREIYSLAYWIANTCQLTSYLKRDPGLCITTCEAQESLSALISEAYSLFVTEMQKKIEKILEPAMMEFESIVELEPVDFVDDWQRFFRRSSVNQSRKSTDTVSSFDGKLSLDSASSNPIHLPNNLNDFVPSPNMSPQSVTTLLSLIQTTLQAYYVPPAIVIQAIAQFFHFISCELFNRVLTYKKYICRSKALQLRMNLSAMEEWVRLNGMPSSLNNAFEPLIQLLQLLQCLSQMDDIILFSSTIQTFDKLNPLQVKRCVQNYRYEVSEPRLPDEVDQLANQMAQEYQQHLLLSSTGRKSDSNSKVIQTRASLDSIGVRNGFVSVTGGKGAGRPASISSLNCLLSNTTNKKRLSVEELLTLSNNAVQQLDDEDGYDDSKAEKRNSKYVLPFSIPITTALLQDWTEERHKKSVHSLGDSNNYSEMIYQEIKLKKQEQLNLWDKIYPSIPEEWLYHLDKRL